MQIRCPRCKELSELEVAPEVGQHIVCPFCHEKFSYLGEMEGDEHSHLCGNFNVYVIIGVVVALLFIEMVFAWCLYNRFNRECAARGPSPSQYIHQVADIHEALQHAERSRRLVQDEIRKRFNALESLINGVEMKIRDSFGERNAICAMNHDDVCRRVTRLSEQIAQISALKANVNELISRMDSMERRTLTIPDVPQRQHVAGMSESPAKMSAESIDELKKRLAENEREIKRLREQNPACVLNTIDPPSNIRNTLMRMTTLKDKPYCMKAQTTYVRDLFYCTKCKSELKEDDYPCCNISRQKSFREWQKARRGVEETKKIRERIDELRNENEGIKKSLDSK